LHKNFSVTKSANDKKNRENLHKLSLKGNFSAMNASNQMLGSLHLLSFISRSKNGLFCLWNRPQLASNLSHMQTPKSSSLQSPLEVVVYGRLLPTTNTRKTKKIWPTDK
jgi:hypothetical protein